MSLIVKTKIRTNYIKCATGAVHKGEEQGQTKIDGEEAGNFR